MEKKLELDEMKRQSLMIEAIQRFGVADASKLYKAMRELFAGTPGDERPEDGENERWPRPAGNRRSGASGETAQAAPSEKKKTKAPREGKSGFEPPGAKTEQSEWSKVQEKIVSLYVKGLSDENIRATIEEIYGFSVSREEISRIIERVSMEFEAWQGRELERVYAFVYVDSMSVRTKEKGKAKSDAIYSVLDVDLTGHKDVLGLWPGENEGADFWVKIFGELKARGVERILFACIEGLEELERGIQSVFPQTRVEWCMAHLQRNSLRYIPSKYYHEFCRDTRNIYAAASLPEAAEALEKLKRKWADYAPAVEEWEEAFGHIEHMFQLPPSIRHMVSATGLMDDFQSALRKGTRGQATFLNDEAVLKATYMRVMDVERKWKMPVQNWAITLGQIDALFPGLL